MLTQLAVWLNQLAGAIASVLFAPIAWLPGWLSAIGACVVGLVMVGLVSATGHCLIRAFEMGRSEEESAVR